MSSPLVARCCNQPPVEAEYTPKGSYETIAGLNTYTVGPADTKKIVIYVYDIFGVTPQALQGADLIASSGVKVWIPDFYHGWAADHDRISGPDRGAYFGEIFGEGGKCNVGDAAQKLEEVISSAKSAGFESVGAQGFCWGAKVLIQSPNLQAKAGVHPSLIAKEDLSLFTVPTAFWPTDDEDKEVFAYLKTELEKKPFKAFVEDLPGHFHGFAAARADLKTEKGRDDFAMIFKKINAFFMEVL